MRIALMLCLIWASAALAQPASIPKVALVDAKRLGKPLLILVTSIDPKRQSRYAKALGAMLNHGPPSLLGAMSRYHVVAMGHVFLRRIGIEANALAYSVEQTGALVVRPFRSPLPEMRDTNEGAMQELALFISKFEHFLMLVGTADPDPKLRERLLAGPLPGIVWWARGCKDTTKVRPTDRRPDYRCTDVCPILLAPTESDAGVYCRTPQLRYDWEAR